MQDLGCAWPWREYRLARGCSSQYPHAQHSQKVPPYAPRAARPPAASGRHCRRTKFNPLVLFILFALSESSTKLAARVRKRGRFSFFHFSFSSSYLNSAPTFSLLFFFFFSLSG